MRVVLIPCLLGATLLLPALAMAQPARQGVPPIDTSQLHARSFDVRGFDPLGLPSAPPALAQAAPPAAPAPAMAPPASTASAPLREARAEQAGRGSPMFSDGWSRNGYGAIR